MDIKRFKKMSELFIRHKDDDGTGQQLVLVCHGRYGRAAKSGVCNLQMSTRRKTVSSFASSFSDEDHLLIFSGYVTLLHYYYVYDDVD